MALRCERGSVDREAAVPLGNYPTYAGARKYLRVIRRTRIFNPLDLIIILKIPKVNRQHGLPLNANPSCHVPVLADEVLAGLSPVAGQIIVDGTLGGGGHTMRLAQAVGSSGCVVSLDRDPEALDRAEQELKGLPIKICRANFSELREVLDSAGIDLADGLLLDLGISSDQLGDESRGFSFDSQGPLDLRFNQDEGIPASELLHRLGEKQLADLIYRYGEERFSRRIAHQIVLARKADPIRRADQLSRLVRRCYPGGGRNSRIHPATRTFQALRIAVNQELDSLDSTLRSIPDCVRLGGRVAIISFHSLEDRLVKQAFLADPRYTPATPKPIRPTPEEVLRNPRCRSAKLRIAECTIA